MRPEYGYVNFVTDLGRPMIIAHRGSSSKAPENTLAAFQLALRRRADAIELDVHLSYDGVPVVIHDRGLERTTNGEGFVDSLLLSDLKKLEAGGWFSSKYRGERIPTLEEVLDLVSDKAFMNIEIKGGGFHYPGIEDKVVRLVEERNLEDRVMISSYELLSLNEVKKASPFVPASLRIRQRDLDWSRDLVKTIDCVNLNQKHVSADKVAEVHRHRLLLHVWTVNETNVMKRVIDADVDGIFTDRPEVLRDILNGQSKPKPARPASITKRRTQKSKIRRKVESR